MRFTLNGRTVDVRAHPMKRLLDVLREDCHLTGTKEGCGEGANGLFDPGVEEVSITGRKQV